MLFFMKLASVQVKFAGLTAFVGLSSMIPAPVIAQNFRPALEGLDRERPVLRPSVANPSPNSERRRRFLPGSRSLDLPSSGGSRTPRLNPNIINNIGFNQLKTPSSRDRLDSIIRLNPGLKLRTISRFNDFSQLRSNSRNLSYSLDTARINVGKYVNANGSLSSFARINSSLIIPASTTSSAQVFKGTDNRSLVIAERFSFRPRFNACGLAVASTSRNTFCFTDKISKKQSNNSPVLSNGQSDKLYSKAARMKTLFRSALANPSDRSKLPIWAKTLSTNQLSSLSRLSSKQLHRIAFNNATNTITRTITAFSPSASTLAALKLNKFNLISRARGSRNVSAAAPSPGPNTRAGTYPLGNDVYLTGFTFGDNYYWSQSLVLDVDYGIGNERIEVIPFASAYYGLGLRFPLQVRSSISYQGQRSKNATLNLDINPINASSQQYLSAGLDPVLLFNGKELVAEVGAEAGVTYAFPGIGNGTKRFSKQVDFTRYLGGRLRGGNFSPPSNSPLPIGKTIIPIDLLGGMGNYSSGGYGFRVTTKPGISFDLVSPSRGVSVLDKNNSNRRVKVSRNRQSVQIKADSRYKTNFDIRDPYYNLALEMTPGLQIAGFVGVPGLTKSLSGYIDFPELSVTIPSGGVAFGCHKGTICARNYSFNVADGQGFTTAERRERDRSQTLTLVKNYNLRDDEPFGMDPEWKNHESRQSKASRRNRSGHFKPRAEYRNPSICAGGEVRAGDWDKFKIDENGVARLWISMELFEGTRCSTMELEKSYHQVDNNNRIKSRFLNEPFLVVPPGQTLSREKKLRDDGDHLKITYTLSNRNN